MPYTCLPLLLGKVVMFHCTDTVEIDITAIYSIFNMKHESAWMLVWIVGETAFCCLCYEWYRPSREIHSWLKHYKGKMLQMSKTNKPQGSAHCIALHQAFRRKHIGEVDQWPRQQRINYCKHFGSQKEWNVMLLPWCLRPICWGIYMCGGGGGCFWCTPEKAPCALLSM